MEIIEALARIVTNSEDAAAKAFVLAFAEKSLQIEKERLAKEEAARKEAARWKNDKYIILHDEEHKHPVFEAWQIQAVRDFGSVRAGELGGYVSSPDCLAAAGDCWIFPNAVVAGKVLDNAIVGFYCPPEYGYNEDNTLVSRDSTVKDNARVRLGSRIEEGACICGNALVTHDSLVRGSRIQDFAEVWNSSVVDHSRVKDKALLICSSLNDGLVIGDVKLAVRRAFNNDLKGQIATLPTYTYPAPEAAKRQRLKA